VSHLSFGEPAVKEKDAEVAANIESLGSVDRWLTKLSKKSDSEHTRRNYLYWLRLFCEYADMTPDGLIAEREKDLGKKDRFRRRRAEERLDRWFMHLKEVESSRTGKKYARSTLVAAYNAVRSFYKANYVGLLVEDAPSAWPAKNKPGLMREDLNRLLEVATQHMHKAYTLCQAQSGLSVSDLLRVTYGDLANQLLNGADHIHLRLLRGKEKQLGFFDTFFGRMSVEALRQYLHAREELEESSRIFPYTARNVNSFLGRMSERAGLGWRVSSHDLRKFFATSLKLARVNDPAFNESLIEYWQGHSLGKVRGAYFVPPAEEQLRLYNLAEPRLEPSL
jgi:integrase